jgi:two-component system, cell cycle sensor histidine kinase and response regulator CckA
MILLDMERMLRRILSDQIKLRIAVADSPQPIYADVSQIELVLLNLAINAQDAMPEGGWLSISISDTGTLISEGAVDETTEAFAVLQVKDNGHGMTAEVKSHLFEPFFTTKQVGKGTGLGLSTVLGIVTKAGGRIDVKSEAGMGTTFLIYLPKVSASPISVKPSALVAPSGGHETILVAEDEAGIRAMTRAYLESLGYRVLEAADGVEAIRLSLEYTGTIHLVVTDVLMPEMRGDTAVEKIQNQRPGIKAIFVSGYTDTELVKDVEQILYKPYEFPELGRRVRAILDGGSADTCPAVA